MSAGIHAIGLIVPTIVSFAPNGACCLSQCVYPRLTPWAAFLRRFAAMRLNVKKKEVIPSALVIENRENSGANRCVDSASKSNLPAQRNYPESCEVVMETGVSGQTEDRVTGTIESQTSKLPSSLFLGLAVGSMVGSLVLHLAGKKHWSLFVGQWAAPFLIMGNYNKMVKQHGSDARQRWAA